MPLTPSGASLMGTPVQCHLEESFQTIVFEISTLRLNGELQSHTLVKDTDNCRAALVTDPRRYLSQDNFSDQRELQASFDSALIQACFQDEDEPQDVIFLVIQFKEKLEPFPAVDGQCIEINDAGTPKLFLVDCGEEFLPAHHHRLLIINSIRTAIKIAFELTGGIESVFDKQCYRTVDGRTVFPLPVRLRVNGTVTRPITVTKFQGNAQTSEEIANQIETCVDKNSIPGGARTTPDFGTNLEELIEALQLEPSTPDAYHRIWFLRLWDRTEKFGESFRPRLQVSNDTTLTPAKEHRNAVAHRGVDRLDHQQLHDLQKWIFRTLKSKLS